MRILGIIAYEDVNLKINEEDGIFKVKGCNH